MHRFIANKENVNNGEIIIDGQEYNHMINVFRLKKDDQVVITDDTGYEYICAIKEILNKSVTLEILSKIFSDKEPKCKVTLYQGLPKGEKMDLIIQKCVELGITEIYPVDTIRSIVKIDEKKESKKIERWNKISQEAAKQSERAIIPKVKNVISYKEAIVQASKNSFCIFPYEKEESNKFSDLKLDGNKDFSIFIGPEGGFDDSEIKLAMSKGIVPITLGKRILRTETAPITVLSILMYILGEMS